MILFMVYVLIYDVKAAAVKYRIKFIVLEYKRGVRFKKVILLSSDRPLGENDDVEFRRLKYETEAQMMVQL